MEKVFLGIDIGICQYQYCRFKYNSSSTAYTKSMTKSPFMIRNTGAWGRAAGTDETTECQVNSGRPKMLELFDCARMKQRRGRMN